MIHKIKRFLAGTETSKGRRRDLIAEFLESGSVPWSDGYNEYKWDYIEKALANKELKDEIRNKVLPLKFGIGIDERCVEYPWIFSRLSETQSRLLDAGSTFNFKEIVEQETIKNKDLMITTYFPESNSFNKNRVSYVFADLRELPFRSGWFDEIVCQSTIEHIAMDNSIYGYSPEGKLDETKNYEYLKVISELIRVLKVGGKMLVTFPYGVFENHGFFQQFDREMLEKIEEQLKGFGKYKIDYFLYKKCGWSFVGQSECDSSRSFNPHTGRGKGDDGAAHCRGICCIEFIKDKT